MTRLSSRLLVGALAGAHSIATVGRRHVPTEPRRILIAHHLLLGDTLMLTPLLAKLRERYPDAEVVMTTPKAIAPLYQHRPYGVHAIPYDPRDMRTLHALRRRAGFDLALIPGDNRYSWLARALRARYIVAFAGDRPAYKSWPVDRLVPYPDRPASWGDMVAALVDGPAPAPYQQKDWKAPDFTPFTLPRSPYAVLHVGASSRLKRWQPEKWAELAAHLEARDLTIVWSGGRGEENEVSAIDPGTRRISFAGRLDLPQLWHLLANAALLVSPDTGVAHLGRITSTPTVTLFGPGSEVICGAGDFWRSSPCVPVSIADFPCRDQRVLFKREIPWVRRCGRTPAQCREPRCMHALSVENVGGALSRIML